MRKVMILPFPPSTNRIWTPRRGGGVRLSNEAVSYKNIVMGELAQQLVEEVSLGNELGHPDIVVTVKMLLILPCFVKKGKHPYQTNDATGRVKFLEDCIAESLGYNDRNNFYVSVEKFPSEMLNAESSDPKFVVVELETHNRVYFDQRLQDVRILLAEVGYEK